MCEVLRDDFTLSKACFRKLLIMVVMSFSTVSRSLDKVIPVIKPILTVEWSLIKTGRIASQLLLLLLLLLLTLQPFWVYFAVNTKMEDIIRCRRLRWLGHLSRMECNRIPRQAHHWEPDGFRRKPGRPRQNWRRVLNKDLRKIETGWDKVQEVAEDRKSWWNRIAQCDFDAGWTRSQKTLGVENSVSLLGSRQ